MKIEIVFGRPYYRYLAVYRQPIWEFVVGNDRSKHPACLRKARRKAERRFNKELNHEQLSKYYSELLGIRKPGIIPIIAEIFFM